MGFPVVDLNDESALGVAQVRVNQVAVGEIAASHLRATGLQQYFFLGLATRRTSQEQLLGFSRRLERAQLSVTSRLLEPTSAVDLNAAIHSTVARLPAFTGVFCANDQLALTVVRACESLGRSVPLDIAVLGCGNDAWHCAFPAMGISSVMLPHAAVGALAAKMLARLLQGERIATQLEQLPPLEVAARGSTLTFADAPASAVRAIAFMRENAYRGIRVQDVTDYAKISRRSLENHVRAVLGHSPHTEIVRLRLLRASSLLESTSLPLLEIARASGFSDGRQMSETFARELSVTPSGYRRRHRKASATPLSRGNS
ncbi:MAG TPA: substrate-binding domain-containing protein [Polyangiaceae bacterium]|nr:substrate-binding domain-containing protein [Polyangiaceae bacterium]